MADDPVSALRETDARGEAATIFADIRQTLGVGVVNLIWRHLAVMPGALPWAWNTLKPLYLGPLDGHAEAVRRTISLPIVPRMSDDVLLAAGVGTEAQSTIKDILASYHHTNALALVAFSALLARVEKPALVQTPHAEPCDGAAAAPRRDLPAIIPMTQIPPEVTRLVEELNTFGGDGSPELVASMYRQLAHWPAYLALARTLLAPLEADGHLRTLTRDVRALGHAHGSTLAISLPQAPPPAECASQVIDAFRMFLKPMARMVGICALIFKAT